MARAEAWVAVAGADAPPHVVARVSEVLRALPDADQPVADALLDAAAHLLDEVLAERARGSAREVALDLLAADACVTWAFEAEPTAVGARAEAAMARLAAIRN
ncbi:MAG: hypothetical protein P3A32_04805 [Gemmatimonadota bacterium]|nr:hypothetical protein [Gemmatimonadota bacterium]MDQ8146714.1 hypothetical protein [Gemmatimonadota bacterium]MDQ8149131.1 hypothetical protein [Gemmatimonadota bacterium]MDQ8157250.1 hypothetical protein [Gemmatimonadota bacterium]MDQ8176067.1 hypothetical protein [Gemmatimonadota bacterium]